MEVIVSTPDQIRAIFREELDSYKAGLAPIPPPQPAKPPYQDRKEVAKAFRISLQTLHAWTAKGTLKSYSIGGRILYKTEEIEKALTEVRVVKYQ